MMMSSNSQVEHDYRARRSAVGESLQDAGTDALLVTTPANLSYLVGFSGETQLGPNPFTGGVSAALLVGAGESIFVVPASDVGAIPSAALTGLELATYETFLDLAPLLPRRVYVAALVDALASLAPETLGVEAVSLPVVAREAIERERAGIRIESLDALVSTLRMRKADSEIAAIRQAISLCDAAQRAIADAAEPGVRESDLLAITRASIERLAKSPLPLIHEVTSGPRSGTIGNSASDRRIVDGDLLLTDIAPRLNGYWGDSCATGFVGDRRDGDRLQMLRIVEEALELGTGAVRAGARARDVDAVMRGHVGRFYPPYHNSGGHGIGIDYHEPPRLVPSETLILEDRMVIALEPGIYLPDNAGIRLEHVVLVTDDGCEILSGHTLTR